MDAATAPPEDTPLHPEGGVPVFPGQLELALDSCGYCCANRPDIDNCRTCPVASGATPGPWA
jgi:hypothetical protein